MKKKFCPNCGKWKSKAHFARYGKYAECRSCANVKDEVQVLILVFVEVGL